MLLMVVFQLPYSESPSINFLLSKELEISLEYIDVILASLRIVRHSVWLSTMVHLGLSSMGVIKNRFSRKTVKKTLRCQTVMRSLKLKNWMLRNQNRLSKISLEWGMLNHNLTIRLKLIAIHKTPSKVWLVRTKKFLVIIYPIRYQARTILWVW